MSNLDDLQKQHEARITMFLAEVQRATSGAESDLALVRALIHRAIHLAAERKSVEFCALATFLAEMIGHAHQLQHGGDKPATHADVAHN
jgi:hypothetical protein